VGAPFEREGAEPNTLGGYLVLVTCIAASLYTQAPNWKKKLLFLGLAGMAFFPFLFTLSRASYLAMIVSMTAVGIFGRKFLIVGLVAAILFLSPILMPTEVKDRVNYTFQRGSGEKVVINGNDTGLQVDKSTYERIYVWEKVKFTLSVAPWFGGGISWGRVLDSQYARVLMESGLFGMVAFVFLLIRILIASRQAAKWTRDWVGRGVAIGVTAATIGLAVHSMGTISFLIVRIMEPFWLLTALCCVVRQDAIMDYARRVEEARVKRAEAARRARAATEAADSEATPTLVHPVANVTVPHPGAYIAPQGYTLR
jgi:O-antigen ligase